ncbi:MAG: hydrogenase [Candidatus Komeilibacteria bacterium CG_4_10_14_0_2_um_filter_37_10]|uniref:Hydrogenase n=1 Tax=Candidatus Komeilibacteria bacterium CG_4_10_14_0_2_um_filter_37_10 TaxID=1974470 RepID=A0A2M7VD56_9BACT|nr:MAG: hydrogenase [Candidatus Komeilibacteria bacterium CG_4_10_14_0_2_um_filter_37_10]
MEILFIIITLIITAFLNAFIKRKLVIEFFSIIAFSVALFESVVIALKVSISGIYSPFVFFSVDSLGVIVMLIIACVGFIATIYSIQYLRQETAKGIIGFTRVRQYFVLLNIFMTAMFLSITANNPVFAWIFIEATTLSTAFLISFYNKPSAIEAAWKYLIINSIGLLLGFFGTILYFTSVSSLGENGFVSWESLLANATHLDPLIAKIAFIFVLIGYGTKVGLVPMHTWKPDAYSKTPNPIGALLSGALLPVAFIVILKFKNLTDMAIGPQFSQNLLIIFGTLSIAVASLIMFNNKNYKRLLAYSSIENAGVMALGFGFGGLAIFATTLHLIYHSLVKGVMFFSSGNLLLKYNSDKINNIKGALDVVPFTSILFIAGFLIVTGVPPFGIFLTKMQILSVGIEINPIITIMALFFMTLVFIGFLKHITSMFFSQKPEDIEVGEGNIWLIIPPMILLIIIIVLSFYIPPFLLTLINDVVSHY